MDILSAARRVDYESVFCLVIAQQVGIVILDCGRGVSKEIPTFAQLAILTHGNRLDMHGANCAGH